MNGSIRPDIEAVMDRTERFHASRKPGQALVEVSAPAVTPPQRGETRPPHRKLNEWSFPEELPACMEQYIYGLERGWEGREGLQDDRIPTICPRFGIVEHYAFFGNEVELGEHTSWGHPVITEWSMLDSLEFREDRLWFRMLMEGYDHLIARAGDRFVPSLRGLTLPMDMANAVRGNDFFLDLYEHPAEVKKLLELCVDAGKWFVGHQKDRVGTYCGGTMCGGGIWLPGDSIGHLSEDASVMCSPQSHEEFGLPYTSAVLAEFDQAFMHLHGAGAHAFPAILSDERITTVELTNDPKQLRSIELYRDHFELLEHRTAKLFVTPEEIVANLDLLKQGRTILWTQTDTQKEGGELVAYVREQLPVTR